MRCVSRTNLPFLDVSAQHASQVRHLPEAAFLAAAFAMVLCEVLWYPSLTKGLIVLPVPRRPPRLRYCWLFRLLLAQRTFCRRFRDACVTTIWRIFHVWAPSLTATVCFVLLRDYGVVGYPLYRETHSSLWF